VKSFFHYTKEKGRVLIAIFTISGVLLLCFPAYGFIFPRQEITNSSFLAFSLFSVIVGFGFFGGATLWDFFSKSLHVSPAVSPAGFQHPLTWGVVIAGLVGQVLYFYLIACVFVYFRNKHKRNNAPQ